MLNLEEYKKWLDRNGIRQKTIYAWVKRLEKLDKDGIDITDINAVNKWINDNYPKDRSGQKASFGSVYQMVAAIRSYLKFLGRKDLANLIEYPKGKMPRRIRVLTDEQIKAMFEAVEKLEDNIMRDKGRILLHLLVETGMRRAEIFNLKPNWISWSENRITIPKEVAKGKAERDVFFSDKTKQLLIEYIEKYKIKPNEKLFGWEDESIINYYIKKIAEIAKLPSWVTPHTFRHTFATRLLSKDVNLRVIQTLLGHSNISHTEIYTHINKEAIKEEAKKAFLE